MGIVKPFFPSALTTVEWVIFLLDDHPIFDDM